jgi:hypothetical protein
MVNVFACVIAARSYHFDVAVWRAKEAESNPMAIKKKKKGYGLEIKTFRGSDGASYLVFRTREGAFNVFVEVEAKEAARQCGASSEGTPRQMWGGLWGK